MTLNESFKVLHDTLMNVHRAVEYKPVTTSTRVMSSHQLVKVSIRYNTLQPRPEAGHKATPLSLAYSPNSPH